jgi:tRNA dimethylallyltransferase
VLTGPTGTGKSDWALAAAQRYPIEIVSVDSAMVYRGLDLGTAKPPRALREAIPHHLIDICEPTESYSAGRFVEDAAARIIEIHARGHIPLLVGGTLLYLRALVSGLARLPQASAELRRELAERAARTGWAALHGSFSAWIRRPQPTSIQTIHSASSAPSRSASPPAAGFPSCSARARARSRRIACAAGRSFLPIGRRCTRASKSGSMR